MNSDFDVSRNDIARKGIGISFEETREAKKSNDRHRNMGCGERICVWTHHAKIWANFDDRETRNKKRHPLGQSDHQSADDRKWCLEGKKKEKPHLGRPRRKCSGELVSDYFVSSGKNKRFNIPGAQYSSAPKSAIPNRGSLSKSELILVNTP